MQAAVVSILLFGCTTWTLTKRVEEKLDDKLHKNAASNIEQVLEAAPNKAATVRPPTTHLKNYPVRRTRHAGHCWRSKDELISDILLWTASHGRAKAGRPARTYIQQFCADTRCSPEDLPEAMADREGWREKVRDIHGDGVTWWWWWPLQPVYMVEVIYALIRKYVYWNIKMGTY